MVLDFWQANMDIMQSPARSPTSEHDFILLNIELFSRLSE